MDFDRYSRQVPMPELGSEGQKKIMNSSALVIGAGGLGSSLLYCLAGAGVGKIGFMDDDIVSLSNLNRQFLHFEKDIGSLKVNSAYEKLHAFNSSVALVPIPEKLTADNIDKFIPDYDIVILAVDCIASRYIVNDACCKYNKPLVNGGVNGMTGMLNLVIPGMTPCLRCVSEENDISDRSTESFAPIVSTISAIESHLAILTLLGKPPLPFDKVVYFSGIDCTFHQIICDRRKGCPACSAL